MSKINELNSFDPDDIKEVSYTIDVFKHPYALAMIEVITNKPIICRLTNTSEEENLKTYKLCFKGKVLDLFYLNQDINNWLTKHGLTLN
jgi:hypothetical protein